MCNKLFPTKEGNYFADVLIHFTKFHSRIFEVDETINSAKTSEQNISTPLEDTSNQILNVAKCSDISNFDAGLLPDSCIPEELCAFLKLRDLPLTRAPSKPYECLYCGFFCKSIYKGVVHLRNKHKFALGGGYALSHEEPQIKTRRQRMMLNNKEIVDDSFQSSSKIRKVSKCTNEALPNEETTSNDERKTLSCVSRVCYDKQNDVELLNLNSNAITSQSNLPNSLPKESFESCEIVTTDTQNILSNESNGSKSLESDSLYSNLEKKSKSNLSLSQTICWDFNLGQKGDRKSQNIRKKIIRRDGIWMHVGNKPAL